KVSPASPDALGAQALRDLAGSVPHGSQELDDRVHARTPQVGGRDEVGHGICQQMPFRDGLRKGRRCPCWKKSLARAERPTGCHPLVRPNAPENSQVRDSRHHSAFGGTKSAMYSWEECCASRVEVHMILVPSGLKAGSRSAPGKKVTRTFLPVSTSIQYRS